MIFVWQTTNQKKNRTEMIEEMKEIFFVIEVNEPFRNLNDINYHVKIKYEEDENMDERKYELLEFIKTYPL